LNTKIPVAIAVIVLIAISSFSFLSIATANDQYSKMATNVRNGLLARSYVRVNGIISQWGTTAVNGQLQSQARNGTFGNGNTNQLASATAIWTTNNSRPLCSVRSKENFT